MIDVEMVDDGAIIISVTGLGSDDIPVDPKRNSASIAARFVLDAAGADFGVSLSIKKGIRPCSGIGSSGASAAGGAFAANMLLDDPLPNEVLVLAAAKAEGVTAGKVHADNVAPSIIGGFTVVRSLSPLEVVSVAAPKHLGVAVAMPDVMVSTRAAREVLPDSVPVRDLVFHVGHAASLALAMERGDLGLLGRSLRDAVFEPMRSSLVPRLAEVETAAMDAGALASFLGGSGPCVVSLFDLRMNDGENIVSAMKGAFEEGNIDSESWVTACGEGCRRLVP